jgi:hypothetical protein
MEHLYTSPELIERMEAASQMTPSENDILEQKISFILGAMSSDSDITKERVEEVLARHDGRRLSAK